MSTTVEKAVERALVEAEARFGVRAPADAAAKLAGFLQELLRWNRAFNLTAIEDPAAVGELHLLDSLAVVSSIPEGSRVADVGTGGGFPGVPLAVMRPDLQVDLLDRTEKKIIFLKTALARLGIRNAAPRQVRLEGKPEAEGLGPFDVMVSRAFTAPPEWIALARPYLRSGGRIVTMLGAERPAAEALATAVGTDRVIEDRSYLLPSGQKRGVIVVEIA